MQFADWCAPWKIANDAENLVLQALQFHWMGICREIPGGAGISHYRPNQGFVEGQLNYIYYSR
jgi:hypothetical protein